MLDSVAPGARRVGAGRGDDQGHAPPSGGFQKRAVELVGRRQELVPGQQSDRSASGRNRIEDVLQSHDLERVQ